MKKKTDCLNESSLRVQISSDSPPLMMIKGAHPVVDKKSLSPKFPVDTALLHASNLNLEDSERI